MITEQNPKIQQFPITDIAPEWDKRLRGVTESGVESLVRSISEIGVMKDAIHVRRKGRGAQVRHILMAGGHRLAAAIRLGWNTIPVRVWTDITDDDALMIEIDDNLSGADLSNLELAVFLAERKRVYERQHPETKAGVSGGLSRQGSATEIISFAESIAEKRELSARHIRNFVHIGNAISPDEVVVLQSVGGGLKLKELMALARIKDASDRKYVIGQLAAGHAASISEAIAKLKPEAPKPDPDVEALEKLLASWKRAPMKVKRRFLSDCEQEIAGILSAKPDLKVV